LGGSDGQKRSTTVFKPINAQQNLLYLTNFKFFSISRHALVSDNRKKENK